VRRLLLLAVLVLAGCGSDDATEASGDENGGTAVELVATEFAFDPDSFEVDEAGETTFRLVNEGEFPRRARWSWAAGRRGRAARARASPGATGTTATGAVRLAA
jgi:hypothetical protein